MARRRAQSSVVDLLYQHREIMKSATPHRDTTHPRLNELMHDVAAGRKTVDEAWSLWVEFCAANGIEPVNREQP